MRQKKTGHFSNSRFSYKVRGEEYREMLQDKVFPWTRRHFGDRFWTFQQDGAPSHKAAATQDLLEENCPDVILVDISPQPQIGDWPPNSPDLNVMDYCIWSLLEEKACRLRRWRRAWSKRERDFYWDYSEGYGWVSEAVEAVHWSGWGAFWK